MVLARTNLIFRIFIRRGLQYSFEKVETHIIKFPKTHILIFKNIFLILQVWPMYDKYHNKVAKFENSRWRKKRLGLVLLNISENSSSGFIWSSESSRHLGSFLNLCSYVESKLSWEHCVWNRSETTPVHHKRFPNTYRNLKGSTCNSGTFRRKFGTFS